MKSCRPPLDRATLGVALAVLLFGGAACEETTTTPTAAVEFTPPNPNFGTVSVTSARTVTVEVRSAGAAPYRVATLDDDSPNVSIGGPDAALFEIRSVSEVLTSNRGLVPSSTTSITLEFIPCPEALASPTPDTIRACSTGDKSANLTLADNTPDGGATTIQLSGEAALPPNPNFSCAAVSGSEGGCGAVAAQGMFTTPCQTINFGEQNATGGTVEACDMIVEVTNQFLNGVPVGAFEIDSFSLRLFDIDDDPPSLIDPELSGFSLRDLDGNPLVVGPDNPFRVAIPPGQQTATESFIVRLQPAEDGTLQGRANDSAGLVITTNDPVERTKAISMIAVVQVPQIACLDDSTGIPLRAGGELSFRGVDAGMTDTRTIRCRNAGRGALTISEVSLTGDDEVSLDNITPANLPVTDQEVAFDVTYAPTDGTPDTAEVCVGSDSVANDPFCFTILGGAFPRIECTPPTLQFVATGGMDEPRSVICENVGDADLVIDNFRIEALEGSELSADDFTITETTPQPPQTLGTMVGDNQIAIEVRYDNNDTSASDAANLVIESNDPANAEQSVALIATDEPCFGPSLDLRAFRDANEDGQPDPGRNLCPGEASRITARDSFGGGPPDEPADLVSCTYEFISGARLVFTQVDDPSGRPIDASFTPAISSLATTVRATCVNTCGAEGSANTTFAIENVCD
jgi:hypothetical protein